MLPALPLLSCAPALTPWNCPAGIYPLPTVGADLDYDAFGFGASEAEGSMRWRAGGKHVNVDGPSSSKCSALNLTQSDGGGCSGLGSVCDAEGVETAVPADMIVPQNTPALSWAAWVWATAKGNTPNHQDILTTKNPGASPVDVFGLYISNGTRALSCSISNPDLPGSWVALGDQLAAPFSGWVHAACTWTGGQLVMWQDGVLVNSRFGAPDVTAGRGAPVTVGYSSEDAARQFEGLIAQPVVWVGKALAQEHIAALAQGCESCFHHPLTAAAELVAHWDFNCMPPDQACPNALLDQSAYGNDGVVSGLSGGPTTTNGPGAAAQLAGSFVAASRDEVEVYGQGLSLTSRFLSASVWFKATSFGGVIVGKGSSCLLPSCACGVGYCTANWHIRVTSTKMQVWWPGLRGLSSSGTPLPAADGFQYLHERTRPTGFNAGTWYHVTASYDGQQSRIYFGCNGPDSVSVEGSLFATPGALAIGRMPGDLVDILAQGGTGDFWDGALDDLRIYNSAISQAEVMLNGGCATGTPTRAPTGSPSTSPTSLPSTVPQAPSAGPTLSNTPPSNAPTAAPAAPPTRTPSASPSPAPTAAPAAPTAAPAAPTAAPASPSRPPSAQPSTGPSGGPTRPPSPQPSRGPSAPPAPQPTRRPSSPPSGRPSARPSRRPSPGPSERPRERPTGQPTLSPIRPTRRPVAGPSRGPTGAPAPPSASPRPPQPLGGPPAPSAAPTAGPTQEAKELLTADMVHFGANTAVGIHMSSGALAAVAGSASGSSKSGKSGTSLSRLSMITSALTCPSESGNPQPLDMAVNPLRMRIGDGPAQYALGAVVGNIIILGGVTVCVALGMLIEHRRWGARARRAREQGCPEPARSAAALFIRARGGWLVIPVSLVFGGLAVGGFMGVISGAAHFRVLAVFALLAICFSFIFYCWRAARRAPRLARFHYLPEDDAPTGWRWVVWGSSEWCPEPAEPRTWEWLALHTLVFDGYRGGLTRHTMALELFYTVVVAAVSAWSPVDLQECQVQAAVLAALPALWALYMAVCRPYIAPYEIFTDGVVSGAEAVMCGFQAAATFGGHEPWEAKVSGVIGVTIVYVIVAKTLFDLTVFLKDTYELWVEHGDQRRGQYCRFFAWFFLFQGGISRKCGSECWPCRTALGEESADALLTLSKGAPMVTFHGDVDLAQDPAGPLQKLERSAQPVGRGSRQSFSISASRFSTTPPPAPLAPPDGLARSRSAELRRPRRGTAAGASRTPPPAVPDLAQSGEDASPPPRLAATTGRSPAPRPLHRPSTGVGRGVRRHSTLGGSGAASARGSPPPRRQSTLGGSVAAPASAAGTTPPRRHSTFSSSAAAARAEAGSALPIRARAGTVMERGAL